MKDDEIRAEVRAWLSVNWNEEAKRRLPPPIGYSEYSQGGWGRTVFEGRWSVPTWPTDWYGRNFTREQAKIVEEAFAEVGAPCAGLDRLHIAANTVREFGQDAIKREVLPKLLMGEARACLLYSEPGAGSDLAAVRTRADKNGDHYIVNGQKVWTSGAMTADYGLLLCRTDWDAPKHKGISYIFVSMKQEGVTIRPIHQITNESHFSEVFLDNVKVPVGNRLGHEGEGWKVLQTALAYERLIMGAGNNGLARGVDLVKMARDHDRIDDFLLRQRIAQNLAHRELNRLNIERARDDQQSSSSSLMSLGKLAMSRILHDEAEVMTLIVGAESIFDDDEHIDARRLNHLTLMAYKNSIGGGSDQIQRNIVSERLLGLPREVEADRHIPFRESRAVKG